MNEISLPSSSSCKSASSVLQKRRSQLAFSLRCLVFFSVILIFYTRFVVTKHLGADLFEEAKYGRKLLSLSSHTAAEEASTNHDEFAATTTPPSKETTLNCTQPSIFEFPSDGFTRSQRQHGWIVLHILIAFFCFWLLAAICDDYFVPAIEQICLTLQMQKDVVGATFMAAATSSPALFMNFVGTFVTKGDIGIGAVVGSAVFNILAVPACCGLFVGQCVRLDWWPVTRDCLMYCLAVIGLIGTIYDGKIMWYEALLLVVGYFFYMTAMYYNDGMARSARKLISKYRHKYRVRPYKEVEEITPLLLTINNNMNAPCQLATEAYQTLNDIEKTSVVPNRIDRSYSLSSDESDYADNPWQRNNTMHEFVFRWPITLLLWLTIPDSRKHSGCKYFTFSLSIVWIGVISYVVAYIITILGDTLNIPDSVMGLTVLAAGMSVPEAVSSIIVTKQGQGAMGISNSIGSNTFDILLCLGVPWFIKAYFLPANANEQWVALNSTGLVYSALFLLTTLFGFYITFALNRFVLDWKVGVTCMVMYIGFMSIASMIELNVFFPVNLPVCKH